MTPAARARIDAQRRHHTEEAVEELRALADEIEDEATHHHTEESTDE